MVFEVGKFSVLFDLFGCKGMKKIRIKQSLLRKIYQKKSALFLLKSVVGITYAD